MTDLFVSTTLMFLLGWYPLIYLWYKTTETIPDDHYFSNFPHYFYVCIIYIIYPLNTMSNYGFAELRVQKSAPCLRQKNDDILGAWWGIA